MVFLTFIAGLILAIVDPFDKADTVGLVLIAVSVVLFLLQVLVFGTILRRHKEEFDRFDRQHFRRF